MEIMSKQEAMGKLDGIRQHVRTMDEVLTKKLAAIANGHNDLIKAVDRRISEVAKRVVWMPGQGAEPDTRSASYTVTVKDGEGQPARESIDLEDRWKKSVRECAAFDADMHRNAKQIGALEDERHRLTEHLNRARKEQEIAHANLKVAVVMGVDTLKSS